MVTGNVEEEVIAINSNPEDITAVGEDVTQKAESTTTVEGADAQTHVQVVGIIIGKTIQIIIVREGATVKIGKRIQIVEVTITGGGEEATIKTVKIHMVIKGGEEDTVKIEEMQMAEVGTITINILLYMLMLAS